MSGSASFKASYRGIGAMLRSKWMLDEMVRRAETSKTAAEADAPIGAGTSSDPPGGYQSSFEVVPVERGGSRRDRAEALLVNTDSAALFVEYGNVRTPGRHVLLRSLDIHRGSQ